LLGLYIGLGLLALLLLVAGILLWQARIKTVPYDRQFAVLYNESIIVERHNPREVVLSWKSGTNPVQILLGRTPTDFDEKDNLLPEEHQNYLVIGDLDPDQRPYFHITLQDGRELVIAERVLPMENVRNFRDVGGYFTQDGRQVAWGKIFRSGHLGNPSENDLDYLEELGMKMAIDLRDEGEIANRPDRLAETIAHLHIFISQREMVPRSTVLFRRQKLASQFLASYKSMLIDQGAKAYGQVLKTLADPQNLPAVLHCTAGKDRTGVAVALLLLALGVPENTVVADYTLSNLYAPAAIQELRSMLKKLRWIGFKVEQFYPIIAASAQNLQRTLQYVNDQYQSVENYLLTAAGLEEEDMEKLRQLLLV